MTIENCAIKRKRMGIRGVAELRSNDESNYFGNGHYSKFEH